MTGLVSALPFLAGLFFFSAIVENCVSSSYVPYVKPYRSWRANTVNVSSIPTDELNTKRLGIYSTEQICISHSPQKIQTTSLNGYGQVSQIPVGQSIGELHSSSFFWNRSLMHSNRDIKAAMGFNGIRPSFIFPFGKLRDKSYLILQCDQDCGGSTVVPQSISASRDKTVEILRIKNDIVNGHYFRNEKWRLPSPGGAFLRFGESPEFFGRKRQRILVLASELPLA